MVTAHEKIFINAEQREAPELRKSNLTCHVMIVDRKRNFSNNDQKELSHEKSKRNFRRSRKKFLALLLYEIVYTKP